MTCEDSKSAVSVFARDSVRRVDDGEVDEADGGTDGGAEDAGGDGEGEGGEGRGGDGGGEGDPPLGAPAPVGLRRVR